MGLQRAPSQLLISDASVGVGGGGGGGMAMGSAGADPNAHAGARRAFTQPEGQMMAANPRLPQPLQQVCALLK